MNKLSAQHYIIVANVLKTIDCIKHVDVASECEG